MAEKDAERRETAGEEIAEEDRDPAKGPDTMLPGGMDVRTAMEHLEARMPENRQHQSEAREEADRPGAGEEAGFTTDWKPTAWQGNVFRNRRRPWKRYKRNGHGSRHSSDTAAGEVGGKEKITLETYAQMAYFERIIARANTRFMVMSGGQHELKRCTEGRITGEERTGVKCHRPLQWHWSAA
ncbi:MAG: hypothetical protein ACLTDI_13510 [Acutalibacteraceae bacterium]